MNVSFEMLTDKNLDTGAMLTVLLLLLALSGVRGQLPYHDAHCGNKQVIVHLFNWKWKDIALECERFLGPKGFCGVQISPPNEHLVERPNRPWSERYAPVSYKLTSRSGTEAELRDMVNRCKRVGVRIYADIVINHMAGVGFSGVGSAGSHFDANKREFSGVPYSISDFNMVGRCPNSDNNIHNLCTDYKSVNDQITVNIFYCENPTKIKDSYDFKFNYGEQLKYAINHFENLRGVVHLDWGMAPTEHAFVFMDNHDNQRGGQLHFDNPVEYKRAVAFTLAFNYGFARVMSSYYFTDRSQPPPHDGDTIKDVTINADGSCGNGWVCEHRWKVIANMVRYRNDVLNTGIENWNVQGDVMWFSRGNVGFFAMGKTNFNKHIYT
uniref:alpha-amylase n=1 Tax=Biomphalaria glabrata TaxID=6526 RepID=A0A2C9JKV1_BIOGL